MRQCPHCQGQGGYYTQAVARYEQQFGFTSAGDLEGHSLRVFTGGTVGYCLDCRRRLGRVEAGKLKPDRKIDRLP